jgi:hypothetical protein
MVGRGLTAARSEANQGHLEPAVRLVTTTEGLVQPASVNYGVLCGGTTSGCSTCEGSHHRGAGVVF